MHISSLSIRNFRNFKKAIFRFDRGINTIVGENGSGKSNVFYALRLLIDDSLPRYVRFSSSDFNRALGPWAGHWIIISVCFAELDSSEEAQALTIQKVGHMDGDDEGSYALFFRPKHEFRKKLHEFSIDDEKTKEGLDDILKALTIDDYESVFLGRGKGDFCDDSTYEKHVGDFDKMEFPDPDDKDDSFYGQQLHKINIHNEVSCTFIKALRDVEADLRSYNNNPLVNLLRGKEKTVEIKKQRDIIGTVNDLNAQIGELEEVKEIAKGIDKSIKRAVGTTYAPNIDIRSELPNEMEKLFQSLKLWVGDPDDTGYKGRIWELSLGGANLIYLSLKLLEYEKARTDRIANFLLIEEPEAHIHTHIQKTLFENLRNSETQIIVSTHSTHISSVSKIGRVNVLCRADNEAKVFFPANGLDLNQRNRVERYLDAVRGNLLFAKGVILVEGDAEQILIPNLFKEVFGIDLDEIGVSIVNVGSTTFTNVGQLFHKDRIQKHCAILTDQDASIIALSANSDDDEPYEKKCRASERAGKARQIMLDKYCKDNDYLKPFYAYHTFEVDLIMEGDAVEFVNCLDAIYEEQAAIKRSKGRLEDSSVSIAGREVLRLAKEEGKGWLALLLVDQLSYQTFIPEYILEAIAFASSHINLSSKAKAARYRIKAFRNNEEDARHASAMSLKLTGIEDQEIVQLFESTFPEDTLTEYLNLV